MAVRTAVSSPMNDPRVEAVLDRLHSAADSQEKSLVWKNLSQLPSFVTGKGILFKAENIDFYDDKYISIGKEQGRLLYLLARATNARTIVEFGTSFGISSIYLSCALRDNGRGGKMIGSEIVPSKLRQACANLEEAGLAPYAEIREGDALTTLASGIGSDPIDLLLLDGFPTLALDVLQLLEPKLRPGALVLVDDVNLFKPDLAPLIAYTQDPVNNYSSTTIALDDGFLMAVRGQ
jgi:predicted O-methyltransferase YrrM